MANRDFYDVIIIGGGVSGLSAGIYALRASMRTLLIEKSYAGGQINQTEAVENYPGFELINGFELTEKLINHAKGYNIEILSGEVEALIPGLEYHSVHLTDGQIFGSHAVIMATGGSPRKLGVPGEEEFYGKGVTYCAVCDGFFFRNKDVVVIGGGDTAVEEALYMAKLAAKVYVVHRRDTFRAGMLLQERLMAESKIEVLWNTVVSEIKAEGDLVSGVVIENVLTREQQFLSAEGVFILIGFKPNNQLVPIGTKMSEDGYVITDEKCETNTPGIFAVGDVREKYARQIVLSAADGCTAALAAAYHSEQRRVKCKLPTA